MEVCLLGDSKPSQANNEDEPPPCVHFNLFITVLGEQHQKIGEPIHVAKGTKDNVAKTVQSQYKRINGLMSSVPQRLDLWALSFLF